jgi:LDH2 family malate/lactate/ureidoglycolate dehydrogenase
LLAFSSRCSGRFGSWGIRAGETGQSIMSQPFFDANGVPSADPNVIFADPPGTVGPLGGLGAEHKGYGLGMMIELLSGCPSGRGRAELNEGWSAAVFLLVMDPAAFEGAEAFRRQVTSLVDARHRSAARPGFDRVRLPGASSGSDA